MNVLAKDLEMLKATHPADPEAFEISVNGKVYTDRKEGGKALTDALYSGKDRCSRRGVLRLQDRHETHDDADDGAGSHRSPPRDSTNTA